MFPFVSRKFSRVVIFLHDGWQWYAYVFAYNKSCWEVLDQTVCSGKNSRQIPITLLEFAEKLNARRVRIVLSQNLQKLENIELPLDATAEELQTVVALAYSQITGSEYGTVRVVSAFADTFNMGGTPDTLFAAGIETTQLEQYEKTCQNSELQFDGCGILEMAAITVGTKYFEDTRFLILHRDKGFYVTCALDEMPMMTSGIILSSAIEDKTRDEERTRVATRRLNVQKILPLQIWYTSDVDAKKIDEIKNTIDPETKLTLTPLSNYHLDIAREIATTTEIGIPSTGGAIIGLPEKEKDPHRAGTWLFTIITILAITLTLVTYQKITTDSKSINLKITAWEKLQNERKKLNDKLSTLDSNRIRNEKITQILNQKNPLPVPIVTLLEEINQKMPIYTKLTTIEQIGDDELQITGYTFFQDGFHELRFRLNEKLRKYNMIVELQIFEKVSTDTSEQKFILRIHKAS
ncbi:MAG: hypothetical protein LBH59_02510 [Planctomycetaceae bacterium]|jgi:hypothetical protein|nr:hypothetical protein [Planctomycetaceae bacterium]